MRNVWTICRRELYSYFVSPVAWVLLAIFAVLAGYRTGYWSSRFVWETMMSQIRNPSMPMSINDGIIEPVLYYIIVVGLLLIPLISMRLFAEEKRQGTIELLITSPIRDIELVIGKWLAAVVMYAALLGILVIDMSFLFIYGSPDWKPVLCGFLGLLLQGAGLLALGAFISTLTKNQIVAGALAFALSLLLLILGSVPSMGDTSTTRFLGYISIITHMESFSRGVIDSKDLIYYLSVIFLGLFLTTRSLESLRWRS